MLNKKLLLNDHSDCPGIFSNGEFFSLKVFNKTRQTRSKYIQKALKFAQKNDIKIINMPFSYGKLATTEISNLIHEMSEIGYIFIVSAGNDGLFFGTITSPASLLNAFTVGSYDFSLNTVSKFSSKGPYLGDLEKGLPLYKPDLLVLGTNIMGSDQSGLKCITKSGTSLSSVIFTGILARVLFSDKIKPNFGYLSFLKLKSTKLLNNKSIFEQGSGMLDFDKIFTSNWTFLSTETPFFSIPEIIDLRSQKNKYFFPLNLQPSYFSDQTFQLNITLNSILDSTMKIIEIQKEFFPAIFEKHVQLFFNFEEKFTYVLNFGISYQISLDVSFKADVEINLKIFINDTNSSKIYQTCVKLIFTIIPRPNREKIIVFDNYHNLVYPFDGKPIKLIHKR